MKKRNPGNGRRRKKPVGIRPVFAGPLMDRIAVFHSAYPKLVSLEVAIKGRTFGRERLDLLNGFLKQNGMPVGVEQLILSSKRFVENLDLERKGKFQKYKIPMGEEKFFSELNKFLALWPEARKAKLL